ncbi:HAD family hydrolase [Butyrivibrio sp. NC2002]|uniref:HAD family hydrolase n=1 Tax=Butyrivibrio sp. NC2002 TaxID=1410610 RepID=UPI000ACAEE39|nr:HAD family phosphatase [Butyrivibrio sp. NC2002]
MNNEKTPVFKRVIALLGVVLLVGMYIVLLIQGLTGSAETFNTFIMCAAATVAIPIAIWLILWAYSAITGTRTIASADPYGKNDVSSKDVDASEKTDNKISTVIFDIGGVLVDFCWDDFLRNKGFDEAMVQRIGDASVRTSDWDEFDRGVLDTKGIIDGFVKNDPEIEDEIRKGFDDLSGLLKKRERTIPWIKALKKAGYRVLVLSNFSKQALEANPFMNEFLDEVDGGILSYRDKVIKPDPAIYKLIMERYDLKPEECVFIDDMQRNIDAAKNVGMNGIVFSDYDQVDRELAELGVVYEI